jgi:long-chain fatty acid transport protein
MTRKTLARLAGTALLGAATGIALANNGMENVGYGARSVGMGGIGVGYGADTTVMNTNPALLGTLREGRAELGIEMMFPGFSFHNPVNDTDGKQPIYLIPSAGLALKSSSRWTFGIGMFNEGGTGTDYGVLNVDNSLVGPATCGGTPICGIEYASQFGYMVIAPTLAYSLNDEWTVGVSPQLGYGMMRMKMPFAQPGLGFFAADMDGNDMNWRVKLGLAYNQAGNYGFGLAYTSAADLKLKGDVTLTDPSGTMPVMRSSMEMDIGWPASFKVGAFVNLKSRGLPLRLALDIEQLEWSKYFDAIPVRFTDLGQSFTMRTAMTDNTVYKLGLEWMTSEAWTLRFGYNHTSNPIPPQGLIAIMNPIVEDHVTFGFGYTGLKGMEFNAAMVVGLNNDVSVGTTHNFAPDMLNSTTGMKYLSMLMQLSYRW